MLKNKFYLKEYIYGLLAFVIWGVNPLYWAFIKEVGSFEILMHRLLWSSIFCWIYLIFKIRKKQFFLIKNALKNTYSLLYIFLSSLIISLNWLTYNYAVEIQKILQASLGYYIAPLMFIFLSLIFLKERLKILQWIAIFIAFVGVFLLTFEYGNLPWISLSLALTFSFYGLIKKFIVLDSLIVLAIELTIPFPFVLFKIILDIILNKGFFIHKGFNISFYLIIGGFITLVPLLLFNRAVKKISLSSIGFMQYIAPTLVFIFGIIFLGENLSNKELPSFLLIWIALILYSIYEFKARKKESI